jgi:chromosome partitioning protein
MRVISVLSQKGGAGKTTVSIHLAAAYGSNTILVDCDVQRSAESWGSRREADFPEVVSHQVFANNGAKKIIEHARKGGAKTVIFDGQPRAGESEAKLAELSDVIIIPTRATILDLEAIEKTIKIAENRRAIIVLNAVNPRIREYAEAVQWLGTRAPGVPIVTLTNRVAYARALNIGAAVSEIAASEGGEAAAEIAELIKQLERIK